MGKILQYPWPGNVRELRHVIEKGVLLSPAGMLEVEVLELTREKLPRHRRKTSNKDPFHLHLTDSDYIRSLLKQYGGKVSPIVKMLGTSRGAFYYYVQKKGIDIRAYRMGYEKRNP